MAWGILVLAGLLEIVWSAALKRADGFAHFWPSAVGIAVSLASLSLLTVALKTLPLATAYAVWVGIGAAGVAAVGIIFMGEPATPFRLLFLCLIVIGVVGLRVLDA